MSPASMPHEFFAPDGDVFARVGEEVWAQILEHCARGGGLETGGVLVGRYVEDRTVAEVQVAFGPPPDSERGRTSFVRGIEGLDDLLEGHRTDGAYYLGEWHHHPNTSARPSARDLAEIRSIADSDEYACPEPLLLIFGGSIRAPEVTLCLVQRDGVVLEMASRGDVTTWRLLEFFDWRVGSINEREE